MTYCIDNHNTDIYFNLATEEYLLRQRNEQFFMLWQSEPAVVIGKYQNPEAEINEEFIHRRQIRLARRFSGGGAVYQDEGNLNLTFIQTDTSPDFLRLLYFVTGFLESTGVPVKTDVRLGIFVDGRKVSGSAQCIHKNRSLYHCTLLFDTKLDTLEKALQSGKNGRPSPKKKHIKAVPSVHSQVGNLREHLPEAMSISNFRNRIFDYFLERDSNQQHTLSREDDAAIRILRDIKYATRSWIYDKKQS